MAAGLLPVLVVELADDEDVLMVEVMVAVVVELDDDAVPAGQRRSKNVYGLLETGFRLLAALTE